MVQVRLLDTAGCSRSTRQVGDAGVRDVDSSTGSHTYVRGAYGISRHLFLALRMCRPRKRRGAPSKGATLDSLIAKRVRYESELAKALAEWR